ALVYFVFCLPGEIAVYHHFLFSLGSLTVLDVSANQFQKLRHLNLCCYAEQDKQTVKEQEEEQTLNNSWNCGGNSCATSPVNQSGLIKIMNQNGKWVMKCRNNGRSKRLFSCVL
ncbi:unnamed protein product, partial [Brassica rapa]